MALSYLLKKRSNHSKNRILKTVLLFALVLLMVTSVQSQTTFTSVQSGNFTDPATWGTATVPTNTDNVVIALGTTVTLNDLITVSNAAISGLVESSADTYEFTVTGDLTINSGGVFNGTYYYDGGGFGYFKGIQLSVAGNIINNGRIDLSVGSSYNPEGVLNLNGSSVQTINGTGTFGGILFSTDNSNTLRVINQLVINNSSPISPNIIWGINNIKIRSSLTLTKAQIDLGANKMVIGNFSTANTVCATGSGFLNGTVGRWYDSNDTFTAITPGVDYYNNNTLFPFISANGKSRAAFITRPNDNTFSAVSGELSVTYFDEPAVSTGYSITDGTYTVTDVFDGGWIIAKDANYAFPIGNHAIAFSIEDAYLIKNGNSRIVTAEGTTLGNHQQGTTTPFAVRIGLSDSDLDNTFQVGYNAALDTPITSVQSGNWNEASTWSSNSIPSCGDTMTILSGHTITVNSTNVAAGVNITTGATMIQDSGSLTIGCTNNNATFSNKGTYSISGGTLTVNGNIVHANGSTFNQTGGDIIIDGNHNGDTATSIDQTLFKIGTASLNLTGGKITIVDPPVSSTTLATTHTVTEIVACNGFFCWFPTNITIDAVDGLSIGQIVVGAGVPAGTTVASINFDGTINTTPSLPATGLSLPLNLSFYDVNNAPAAFVYESSTNYAAGVNHTLQIGDGISTEKSAVTTTGYSCNFKAADGTLSLSNLTINAPDATNRFVSLDSNNINFNAVVMNVQNDFTITQGKMIGSGVDTYFGGNIVNNGALNIYNTTYFGNYIDGNFEATANPQTISGTGTFNAQTDPILNNDSNTGSASQLRVNNTSPEGVTFLVPFNVVNGLSMEAGIIHTSATSVLKVGAPAMSYTASLSGNFGETCYIDGPFAKDIGGGQNANDLTNGSGFIEKFFFPVGKSTYAPIWVAVTTPSGGFGAPGTNIKVEAFETNTGTPSSNIAHLSQNRWEVSKTDGTVTDFNIRVADASTIESSIIVQAPSASGVYDNDFGITSTFESGTPNILTSTSDPLPFSSFKGYFSTARQSECSAVNPGNTVASETNICGGKSVALSLQNIVVGEGITYQWQSSSDNSIYSDIDGATATTCSVSPLENTYYRCNVTCSYSTTTVASTPIQITLNNTITTTIPATICMPTDTAVLSATSLLGDVKWYTAQTGGAALFTGNSFTTPAITETTTYYAGTETTTDSSAGLVYTEDGYSSGNLNRGLAFTLSNSIILNSVKVYPQQNPDGTGTMPITIKVFQNGVQVPGTSDVVFTPNTFSGWSPTNDAQTVALNYQLAAGDNYTLLITEGASYDNALAYLSPFPSPFPVSNGAVTIIGGYEYDAIDTYNYNFFFDWDVTEVCSSARIPVIATVQTAEECDLGNPAVSESLAKIVAYPNPYNTAFKLAIQTNSASDIGIKVYDMVGRLLEHRNVSFTDLSNVEIGTGYPSGIYNVMVLQEGKTKTLQVIKR
jgi:hypothetical protein